MNPSNASLADRGSTQERALSEAVSRRRDANRPLHPRFGVEVRGLNLTTASDADILAVRQMIARYGLVLLAKQDLDDAALETVSRRIGDGRLMKSARTVSHGRFYPEVSNLTTVLDETGKQLGFAGASTDYWHSDQEFRLDPATLATLYCIIPSATGGETSFASTRVKALDLPADEVEALRPLWSTRRPASTHDNADHVEVAHPVVLGTPDADTESLYTLRFIGRDAAEGLAIKERLMQRIIQADNIYSHRWRARDLLIYDNTQVVHRREAFSGERWLKATKIFAHIAPFQAVDGFVAEPAAAELPA